mgnify:FL=1
MNDPIGDSTFFQEIQMPALEWNNLRAPQLRTLATEDALVIIPAGSTEQHGPHLPVQVDALLATEVALGCASRFPAPEKALVTPTIWCGLAEHHMEMGGTFTLDHQTYHSLLRCICSSVQRHGFRRICVINGHGGNIHALHVIASELKRELEMRILVCTYWTLPEVAEAFAGILEKQQNVRHAGEAETSMMLHLKPELVDQDALPTADGPSELKLMGPGAYRWQSFKELSTNGVIGFPSAATAKKGERLLEAAASGLCRMLTDPETWSE